MLRWRWPRSPQHNAEATEAWSGPLFERFVKYRDLVDRRASAPTARRRWRPIRRSRATGSSTSAAASATPPSGSPGWSARRARRSASTSPSRSSSGPRGGRGGRRRQRPLRGRRRPGRRVRARASTTPSRGWGSCSSPTRSQALRNVRAALAPGGRLCAVVWRRKLDNEWVRRAEQVVEEYLDHPEETDLLLDVLRVPGRRARHARPGRWPHSQRRLRLRPPDGLEHRAIRHQQGGRRRGPEPSLRSGRPTASASTPSRRGGLARRRTCGREQPQTSTSQVVGLDPHGRVLRADVAQSGRGRGEPARRRQPCSSGAIVRPASLSCSQYSSAGSLCRSRRWPARCCGSGRPSCSRWPR